MDCFIKKELAELARALLLGISAGFFYDVLRPLRYKAGHAEAADILFCTTFGALIFLYFMKNEYAAPGPWQVLLIPVGFWLYNISLSGHVIPIFTVLLEKFIKTYAKSEKIMKNLLISAKNIFQNMR